MAYTAFVKTTPDASTQSIAAMGTSTRDNQQAIIDGILYGGMKGWDGAAIIGTGSAAKPQFWKLNDGSDYLLFTPTWHSTLPRIESMLIEWSSDDITYYSVGTITITYSGNYYASHAWS